MQNAFYHFYSIENKRDISILKKIEELVFGCVGYFSDFSFAHRFLSMNNAARRK